MANEMRDRLVELLKTASYYLDEQDVLCNRIADHLIENGVVVPPCKAGDKVYFIDTCTTAEDFGKKYVSWGEVLQLSFNGFGKWVVLTSKHLLNIDEILLTKEEAEQKLKEMRGADANTV
jgi:hypothetical protein